MRIPYEISGKISRAVMEIDHKNSTFYFAALRDIFFGANFLSLFVEMVYLYSENTNLKKLRPNTVEAVLRHICCRTWNFGKLFEFIRSRDVVEGKLQLGIAAACLSERSVKTALKVLSEVGILIKLRLHRSIAISSLYMFNIYHMLPFLAVSWENELLEIQSEGFSEVARCRTALLAQKKLRILVNYTPIFRDSFKVLLDQTEPIKDVENFLSEIKAFHPDFLGIPFELKEELKKVKVLKKELAPGKWRRESDIEDECLRPILSFTEDYDFENLRIEGMSGLNDVLNLKV